MMPFNQKKSSQQQHRDVFELADEVYSLKSNGSKNRDIMNMTQNSSLSSLYEIPLDKPLGIDVSKFLTTSENVNYEGNDMTLIQEALKQHKVVDQVLHKRQKNLRTIQKWWFQGSANSTINALSQ